MRPIHKIFPDAKKPTEKQRQELCKMLFKALVKIRLLSWQGKSEQAAALSDAFHNLPTMIWSEDFSFAFLRQYLESYHRQFPPDKGTNFLQLLGDIIEGKDLLV